MPELPPSNQLSWRVPKSLALSKREESLTPSASVLSPRTIDAEFRPSSDQNDGKPQFFSELAADPLTWAAAADGAVAGWSILESALKIDPQVLDAMEFSTAQDLHGLADFHTYVQDHFFSAPLESADGWFNRLTGYVAEQKAASFFEQTGHHVVFAPVANQPVWDMLVDGHAIQIKENLAGLKDFALAHPDIPAFTNLSDAAAVHASSVHGLAVLDKDSIHAAASGTVGGLDGTFDPGFSFPVITTAFSAYREAKLLFDEHTTVDRALLNVGMDVAGVGGGALVGGKIGAFLGSIIPGPGTVVGGIAGSILGGVFGKMASTCMRKMPFYTAREDYNTIVQSAQLSIEDAMDDSKERVRDLQRRYQTQFEEFRDQIEAKAKAQIAAKRVEYESSLMDFCSEFTKFLEELKLQLRQEEGEVASSLPSSGFLGAVLLNDLALRRRSIGAWFRRAKETVDREIRAYQEMKPRNLDVLLPEVTRFLAEFSFELKSLEGKLNDLSRALETQTSETEMIKRGAVSEIEEQRETLIRQFRLQVTSLHESIVRSVQNWNRQVSTARDTLRRQAAAVGISL